MLIAPTSLTLSHFLTLSIYSYQLSLLVGPLDYIQCTYNADEFKYLLFSQHSCVYV